MFTVLHCKADNDSNGNPRRLFLVVNAFGEVVDAIDERHNGDAVLRKNYTWSTGDRAFFWGPSIDVTVAWYKSTLAEFSK